MDETQHYIENQALEDLNTAAYILRNLKTDPAVCNVLQKVAGIVEAAARDLDGSNRKAVL